MTLQNVFNEEKTRKIIEVMPDFVGLWKIVLLRQGEPFYCAPTQDRHYSKGINETAGPAIKGNDGNEYQANYHFWVKEMSALRRLNGDIHNFYNAFAEQAKVVRAMLWGGPRAMAEYQYRCHPFARVIRALDEVCKTWPRVVKAVTHKEDITAIGSQEGDLCVVTQKVYMPAFPDVDCCIADMPEIMIYAEKYSEVVPLEFLRKPMELMEV